MNQINEAMKRKIFEKWIPKLEKRFKEKGITVNENRMKEIAMMAHTRAIFESTATLANTPGRGAFSFGNNPMNSADQTLGSAEMFQKLFGVFVDVSATTFGLDLLPVVPMNKSSITMVVAEPIYAGGKKDSTTNRMSVFQVKSIAKGTQKLNAGSKYEITLGNAGDKAMTVEFVGKHMYNGNLIFKLVSIEEAQKDNTISEILDSATTNAGIYTDATNNITFNGSTVDYVNGFTNFVAGFTGSGVNDEDAWTLNRNDGKKLYNPMDRETGESTAARTYGARMWNKNFAAGTFNAEVAFTTEQIQDAKMDHDFDMLEFGDTILGDSLSQSMNNHILSYLFAAGWDHHKNINEISGLNLNTYLGAANETGQEQSFVGLDGITKSIAGASGVLPSSGAIAENLSTLQKRIITRMFYASTIVKNRSRVGKGDTTVFNGTHATAVRDIKGFALAPFQNSISDDASLTVLGDFYGIKAYEDSLMDMNDGRIAVFCKGNEKKAGIKYCPYILAERLEATVEGTMQKKVLLKSRYTLAQCGSHPETPYLTFCVENGDGYSLV